jgi:hypothetical protein
VEREGFAGGSVKPPQRLGIGDWGCVRRDTPFILPPVPPSAPGGGSPAKPIGPGSGSLSQNSAEDSACGGSEEVLQVPPAMQGSPFRPCPMTQTVPEPPGGGQYSPASDPENRENVAAQWVSPHNAEALSGPTTSPQDMDNVMAKWVGVAYYGYRWCAPRRSLASLAGWKSLPKALQRRKPEGPRASPPIRIESCGHEGRRNPNDITEA